MDFNLALSALFRSCAQQRSFSWAGGPWLTWARQRTGRFWIFATFSSILWRNFSWKPILFLIPITFFATPFFIDFVTHRNRRHQKFTQKIQKKKKFQSFALLPFEKKKKKINHKKVMPSFDHLPSTVNVVSDRQTATTVHYSISSEEQIQTSTSSW